MIRKASIPLIALAMLGCENAAAPPATATIEFQGVSYDLVGVGECGARPDGSYSTWAFMLDSNGEPLLDGPQMLALSEEGWSVIDFYLPEDDRVIRVYRKEPDAFGFEDGVLEFEGELGAGLTEKAKVRIVCPGWSSSTSQPIAGLQERLPGRILS